MDRAQLPLVPAHHQYLEPIVFIKEVAGIAFVREVQTLIYLVVTNMEFFHQLHDPLDGHFGTGQSVQIIDKRGETHCPAIDLALYEKIGGDARGKFYDIGAGVLTSEIVIAPGKDLCAPGSL